MATVKLSDIVSKYEDASISGDFGEWLEKLELVAKLQKIDDLKSFLPLFLHGAAFAVYKQLSEDEKDSYKDMKASLLRAFGMNCFSAYEELQRRVFREGETVDVYLADLRRLVVLMGQTSAEPLLKCAFIAGLPADICVQLKSMAAVESLELSELVSRARMMLSTRNSGGFTCAVGAHVQKPRRGCYTCGAVGHMAWGCPKSVNKAYRPPQKPRTCYICDDTGHFMRDCPQRSSNVQSKSGNAQGGVSTQDAPPSRN